MSSSSGELPITSVFSCGARSLTACASFKFAGCWWRRSLAVDGGSGTRPGAPVHSRRLAAPGRGWPASGPGTIQRRHPVTAGAPGKTARARGTVGRACGTRARTAQARPWTGIPDTSLPGSSPSRRMAATGAPAGLASRWPRRDARLRTSGAARRSPEGRHRAAAARRNPLRRTGSLAGPCHCLACQCERVLVASRRGCRR